MSSPTLPQKRLTFRSNFNPQWDVWHWDSQVRQFSSVFIWPWFWPKVGRSNVKSAPLDSTSFVLKISSSCPCCSMWCNAEKTFSEGYEATLLATVGQQVVRCMRAQGDLELERHVTWPHSTPTDWPRATACAETRELDLHKKWSLRRFWGLRLHCIIWLQNGSYILLQLLDVSRIFGLLL